MESMKKTWLFWGVLLISTLSFGQDYIISWKGDTLQCRLVQDPKKERLKPVYKFRNGHLRMAVVFPNDSIRTYDAGQIRGYYRKTHGKSFLCDGHFESVRYRWNNRDSTWYFMNRLFKGTHAGLYRVWLRTSDRQSADYYLYLPHAPGSQKFFYIEGFSTLRKMLSEPEVAAQMKPYFSSRKVRHYENIVRQYDRLKTEAALK